MEKDIYRAEITRLKQINTLIFTILTIFTTVSLIWSSLIYYDFNKRFDCIIQDLEKHTLPIENRQRRDVSQVFNSSNNEILNRNNVIKRSVNNESENIQKRHKNRNKAVAHFVVDEKIEREYESGPMVSFNKISDKDVVYRFWKYANFINGEYKKIADKVFLLHENDGHLAVKKSGLYFVYAQVVYHDLSGRWSFGIYVGDTERVKCIATEQLRDNTNYDPSSHGVYHQCYTAQIMYIKEYQSISLRCLYGSRKILTKPDFTYWGIIQL